MTYYLKDSRGNPSATLSLIFATWLVMTAKFLFSGANIPFVGTSIPISISEYGVAVVTMLAGWLGREYQEKVSRVKVNYE